MFKGQIITFFKNFYRFTPILAFDLLIISPENKKKQKREPLTVKRPTL